VTQTVPRTAAVPIAKPRRRAPWPVEFYRSAVGKKWLMALSGIVLMGFVISHLIGNLKLYLGRGELDLYGEALRSMPGHLLPRTFLLWTIRAVLIAAFFVHVQASVSLTRMNQKARTTRYQSPRDYLAANYASRTMRWSGVIVLLYLAFHLMDLTWGFANGKFVRGDPYNNLIFSLQRPVVAVVYVLANLALGVHLTHGAWSMFQSLGVNNPRINAWRRHFARAFAAVIVVGNLSFPVMVQLHVVEPTCGTHRTPTTAQKCAFDEHAPSNATAVAKAG
jgi:succinate dehydrogenase / fumarate reductase cytochrome b subunit